MNARHRRAAIPFGLALIAFSLAVLQAPGQLSFETKVNLHVDPVRFLADVLSVWSPSFDVGHVQSGQYLGYLFPTGPVFVAGHVMGLPAWLVDRLWLGGLLALAGWGVVRMLDALLARERGIAHATAGLAFILNPYVITLAERTTVFLLAYAAVPWLLLAVHRGLCHPRGWWWPAAFALIVAAMGGGVNAATVAWVLLAPVLLVVYEAALGDIAWRAAGSFGWRAVLASAGASLWWIAGVLIGGIYGVNFLPYIEQPGTIWQTTSVTEALRGMGYWISYAGVGFAGRPLPLLGSASTLLFSWPVYLASLLVPAVALAGFQWTRRWRYGPFFLALTLVGVGIVAAGFPEGTPLRQGLHFIYNRVTLVQFLRTSYKAGPLIMIGVATLLGTGVGAAVRRLGDARRGAGWALVAATGLALVLSAWPLFTGDAVGLQSRGVPAAWRRAASDLDRELPANSRALVLPGQLFSFYTWGGTVDPILPVLSTRPVAQRSITPNADLHATDLLWTVDQLVQQQRLYPGQLAPLLSLLGVRSVITGSDDDDLRAGSVDPTLAAKVLAGQGLGAAARSYGPSRAFPTPASALFAPLALPEVRRYDLPASRGIVSVEPRTSPTIVDGSAEALAGLAAFGALPAATPLFYAGDLSAAQIRAMTAGGGQVVISDSNRRRVFVNSEPFENLGPTVAANDTFSADAAVLNPFAARGTRAQTVAVLTGVRYIRAPYSPGYSLFPEHRPFAAFDGSPSTAWLADRGLDPGRRWIEVGFLAPRDVPSINVLPEDDARGTVVAVAIAGRRHPVHPGWNHLVLGLHHVSSLRVRIAAVRIPQRLPGGAGGLAEIRVPGLHVTEALRVPQLASGALAGRNLGHVGLSYLFERTTGDDPLQRMRGHGAWQAGSVRDAGDGETGLRRLFTTPAARRWSADAWLSLSPDTPDSRLDRLAGYHGPVIADSSGRFLNEGGYRASSAFDRSAATAWVGELEPGQQPWLAWRLPQPVAVRTLRLVAPVLAVRVPARVVLTADGRSGPVQNVAADGALVLPRAVRGRAFRLTIVSTRVPAGAPSATRTRRAVGIAEITGAGVPPMAIPRGGPLRTGCGLAQFAVGGVTVALRPSGTVSQLDRGAALPATQCGPAFPLAAGAQLLTASEGVFRIDWLRLRSSAPAPVVPPPSGGRVLAAGRLGRASVSGVRVALRGPSWLVLGESYDRGWRASCDGRSLGPPTLINGYANGWRAPAGCTAVTFSFGPQQVMAWVYALSALIAIGLVALLLLRRAPRADVAAPFEGAKLMPTPRLALGRSVLLGITAGVVLGFIFSIRSGVVIAPAVTFICWRGIGTRALILTAALLLGIVVPVIYLLRPFHDLGGYDFNYAIDLIDAHWVAVAAVVLLVVALVRTLSDARAARDAPPPAR